MTEASRSSALGVCLRPLCRRGGAEGAGWAPKPHGLCTSHVSRPSRRGVGATERPQGAGLPRARAPFSPPAREVTDGPRLCLDPTQAGWQGRRGPGPRAQAGGSVLFCRRVCRPPASPHLVAGFAGGSGFPGAPGGGGSIPPSVGVGGGTLPASGASLSRPESGGRGGAPVLPSEACLFQRTQ